MAPNAPPAEPPALPPTPFGKYYLVRKLAEGGMAEIFLAKQMGAEGFERNVVIKRMLSNLSSAPDFVTMFLDEARLAAKLSHPNIVQIHDLGHADGCYYICMEYLAGEDFSTVLRSASKRREYVPMGIVLRVIIEAANGLHFAHEFTDDTGRLLGVVHRDISPSNIFVTYVGQVKVLDFGIAKAETRATQTTAGVVKGKYMYMAPEQARSGKVDRRADVFSLGVSLYEALTNTRPFARDVDLAILNAVLTGDFRPPRELRPDIPPELEAVVLKAMAGDAEQRYHSASEMAADLEQILASAPVSTGQVSQYLRSLFGEERITQKTRIPTLVSLTQQAPGQPQQSGPDRPATASRPLEPGTQLNTEPAQRTAPEPGASSSGGAPRWLFLAGGLGLGALVAAGGIGYARLQHRPEPQPVVVTVVPAPPSPVQQPPSPPVQEPAPAPVTPMGEPSPDAGLPAAANPENPPADEPEEPAKPVVRRKVAPVQLDATGIQKVVSKGRGPIVACFESFKQDLPGEQGQVNVSFTILGSGKVVNAKVGNGFDGTRVGKCLEQRVARLRFPTNKDKEITLSLPFGYRVQR